MKQEQRNAASLRRIGESALETFSQFGYAGATVNGICSSGHISKGVLYYYFKDKDELYLHCVKDCFDRLSDYLRAQLDHPEATLEACLDARLVFFQEHPLHQRLFCDAVILPQPHLKQQILACKAELDQINCTLIARELAKEQLRPDITLSEAVDFYRMYQNFINTGFLAQMDGVFELDRMDRATRRAVKLFLYGVVDRADGAPHED